MVLLALALPALLLLTIKAPYIFPLGIYFFFLPFDSVLIASGTPGQHAATFTKFLGIMSIAALLVKGIADHKLKKPVPAVLWWVAFIAFALLSGLWSINLDMSQYSSRVVTAVGLLSMYTVVAIYPFEEKEYETLKKFVIYGGLAAAIFAAHSYDNAQTYMGSGRATLESNNSATDPNQFAFSLLIPFGMALQYMLTAKKPLKALLYAAVFAVLAYAILITGSRGGALGALIISVILFYNSAQRNRAILTALVLAAIVIFFAPHDYYQRATVVAYQTGGAGRLDIWKVGLEAFRHNWLMGVGLDNFPFAYDFYNYAAPQAKFEGSARAPHNLLLLSGVEFGIVGLIIIVLAMIMHYKLITRSSDTSERIMLKACFMGCISQTLTIDVIWRKSFWLLWMLIVIHNLTQSNKKNQNNINTQN